MPNSLISVICEICEICGGSVLVLSMALFSDPNRFWPRRSKIEDEDEFEDEDD